jgi:hypothetical protein
MGAMNRNTKLNPLPPGYEYVNPEQAAITRLFGPSTGQFPGDPRMALSARPSLIPPPDNAPIAYGRYRVGSPNGDIASEQESRVGSPNAAIVEPTPAYASVFAPPPRGNGLPDFRAMPPFGQPGSPLDPITAAQQKTPAPPPQFAPPQPLGPVRGASGMNTGPGLAGTGPRRGEPPP